MTTKDFKARLKELYLPSPDDFVLVDVPDMQFVMVDGEGAEDRHALDHAVKWLFTVIHPMKRIARQRLGRDYVEPPLEGQWWADDLRDFVAGNRAKLKWRMMIVLADWVTGEMFRDGVAAAQKKLGTVPHSLRLDRLREGRSVQIMHVGPATATGPVIARMHGEFMKEHHLVPSGHHHEIYLNDPKRVAPAKLKTVLRQPVREAVT